MSMVHDNIILSYQADFESGTLTLKTRYYNDEFCEDTDVVFTGYLTHIFYDILGENRNIIFDIEEYPMNLFLERERELLSKRKNHCWPISYENFEDLINFFQSNTFKVFSIDSSLGLWGYIIAKEMNVVVKNQILKSDDKS